MPDIIEDNTGGEPAGPDLCGEVYVRLDGTLDEDHPCVLVPGHGDMGDPWHEDEDGETWR